MKLLQFTTCKGSLAAALRAERQHHEDDERVRLQDRCEPSLPRPVVRY